MWDRVAALYNSDYKPRFASDRDADSIRAKFKTLKNATKPTGDPTCPPEVVRAKHIAAEIERGVGVIGLDDDNDDDQESISSSSSSSKNVEDSSDDESSSPPSPILGRHALGLLGRHVVEETQNFIVPETLVARNDQVDDAQPPIIVPNSDEEVEIVDEIPEIHDEIPEPAPSQRAVALASQVLAPAPSQRAAALSSQVPSRLGKSKEELKAHMDEMLKNSKKKHSSVVPENPTHTKKKAISQHIADLDKDFDSRVQNAEKRREEEKQDKQMKHELELKRLELQHAMQERRFEEEGKRRDEESRRRDEESRRHETLMLTLISSIMAGRPPLPPPPPPT